MKGYTGAATVSNSSKLDGSSVVSTGTVSVERDLKACSGRTLKLCLVDTPVAGSTAIANHLVKNTNYTVTLANVPTPMTATG